MQLHLHSTCMGTVTPLWEGYRKVGSRWGLGCRGGGGFVTWGFVRAREGQTDAATGRRASGVCGTRGGGRGYMRVLKLLWDRGERGVHRGKGNGMGWAT